VELPALPPKKVFPAPTSQHSASWPSSTAGVIVCNVPFLRTAYVLTLEVPAFATTSRPAVSNDSANGTSAAAAFRTGAESAPPPPIWKTSSVLFAFVLTTS
jgi:hypothetical protein